MNFLRTLLIVFCLLIGSSSPAHAYLDPGTGSLILQVVVASLLGAILTIKLWWAAVRKFFARIFGDKKEPDEDSSPEPSASDSK